MLLIINKISKSFLLIEITNSMNHIPVHPPIKSFQIKTFLVSILTFLLVSCPQNKKAGQSTEVTDDTMGTAKVVKRFGMVTGIKHDEIDYYKKLHASVWPGVLKKIKECNIQNYSIYLQKIKDDYYLFSYFEYTGNDFDSDMKKMGADTTTQRWWKETDGTQLPLPEAVAKKQIWTSMEEVFHKD
jgi:L-rhamnose mutarotase